MRPLSRLARLARPVLLLAFVLGVLLGRDAQAFGPPGGVYRLARGTGKALGFGAGVVVTGALSLSRKWNRPLIDAQGKPVTLRIDNHDFTLRKRHAAVLGPKIVAAAARMQTRTGLARFGHSLVLGFGQGATVAPGVEGRLEAKVAAHLQRW